MPKSATCTRSGQELAGQPPGHLDAEAVVAEEDVADPGHQDPARSRPPTSDGSTSSGWK